MQIAEIDAINEEPPQVVKTYLWDPSEPVAPRILHMTVWNNGTETESLLYYTHDLQKNVTALFGQAAGRRAQYEHDPYGNPINTTGDAAGQNPYRYSSEYHDEDLGLIYYNYRHYNPTDGRWINRDPIAEQGGINLYAFVANRLMSIIDIRGKTPIDATLRKLIEPQNVVPYVYNYRLEGSITTIFADIKCCCIPLYGNPPKFGIACRLVFDAVMDISLDQAFQEGKLTLEGLKGLFGHEQQHMKNAINFMQKEADKLLSQNIPDFLNRDQAAAFAARVTSDYQRVIGAYLKNDQNHLLELKNQQSVPPMPNSVFLSPPRDTTLPDSPNNPRSWPVPTRFDQQNHDIQCP